MLKQRIITAVLLVAVLLAVLFLTDAGQFGLLAALLMMFGAWEWANLSGFDARAERLAYSVAILLLLAACAIYTGFAATEGLRLLPVRNVLCAAGVWWALALLWVQTYPSSALLWGSRWLRAIMGVAVLVPTWLALVMLRQEPYGQWLIVLMFALVASADIGAYFSGRAFGKHKLAPRVSPGKSWEGVIGGIVAAIVLASVVGSVAKGSWLLVALAIPTIFASVLGDLLESMVKRHRGIKDSGTILPGHGGVLDRIDSLTAAAPVFALAVLISGWQL